MSVKMRTTCTWTERPYEALLFPGIGFGPFLRSLGGRRRRPPSGGARAIRRALILGWAYYLDAFSSYPLRTWLPSVYRGHDNWYNQRCVLPGPLVLGKGPLNALTPTPDMDRTVSRRSEPSSRTALNGRTAQPLEHTTAPGGEEPTSRCQTFPSM
ncbi:hypothetical protein RND81_O025600 [Saponaria officinalis]|uniref:Uncharacterized protein n=1 Tax=Saponaria officinalis TaxID=3572 RepID=A0AAW1GGG3_SAPOF